MIFILTPSFRTGTKTVSTRESVFCSGIIKWDVSKPDGAARKLLDNTRIKSMGWDKYVNLDAGLESTYQWYKENYG